MRHWRDAAGLKLSLVGSSNPKGLVIGCELTRPGLKYTKAWNARKWLGVMPLRDVCDRRVSARVPVTHSSEVWVTPTGRWRDACDRPVSSGRGVTLELTGWVAL